MGDARQASDPPDPTIQVGHQRDAIGVEVRSIVRDYPTDRAWVRAMLPLERYFDEKIPSRVFGNPILNPTNATIECEDIRGAAHLAQT